MEIIQIEKKLKEVKQGGHFPKKEKERRATFRWTILSGIPLEGKESWGWGLKKGLTRGHALAGGLQLANEDSKTSLKKEF